MRRSWAFFIALFLVAGCASEGDKAQWAEFWKDLRGDNMQMQSDRELGARPSQTKVSN